MASSVGCDKAVDEMVGDVKISGADAKLGVGMGFAVEIGSSANDQVEFLGNFY